MTRLWMLDTNAISLFMHGRSRSLDGEIAGRSRTQLCISAISYGETLYGLAHRPDASRLARAAAKLFEMVRIMPWSIATAEYYGPFRADMRRTGISLQPLDLLIAAHALEAGATLVTSDAAFRHVPGLTVEDWTAP
jgi:tRNA(fMet)-specific endonuclease VapC